MVARFSDTKALAFAFNDLLAIGVEASCMHAHFDQVADEPRPAVEHLTYLERLHEWTKGIDQHPNDGSESIDAPRSANFKVTGGALEFQAPGRDTAAVAVIVHHGGELVA
jgi:hypothetical protein